jgi:predicted GNAT family acetyltransferase
VNQVVNNQSAQRFELHADGVVATLGYAETSSTIDLVHTKVPSALAGRGLGSALARTALNYARDARKRVIPTCPFVRRYIARHPEYAGIVERAPNR